MMPGLALPQQPCQSTSLPLGQVDFQAVLEPGSTLPRLLVPCASCLSPWHLVLSLCCSSLVSSFYQTTSPTGVLPGRHIGTVGRATRRANQQTPDPVPGSLQGLPCPPALQEEKGAALVGYPSLDGGVPVGGRAGYMPGRPSSYHLRRRWNLPRGPGLGQSGKHA